jgi:hypothetical protein
MRVTVEPEPLIGIVALVGERERRRGNAASAVRLSASAGKVCIEGKATSAVTDAAVWEEGQCSVSLAKLLAALEGCRALGSVTLRVDDLGLRMGNVSMPVAHYAPQADVPANFQIFLATKSGTISSQHAPQPLAAAA